MTTLTETQTGDSQSKSEKSATDETKKVEQSVANEQKTEEVNTQMKELTTLNEKLKQDVADAQVISHKSGDSRENQVMNFQLIRLIVLCKL